MSESKSLGSIYVNYKKGTDEGTVDNIRKAVKFLKDNNVYLSMSVKDDDGSYTKLSGFFNGYKKKSSDPDLIIRASQVAERGGKPTKKAESSSNLPW